MNHTTDLKKAMDLMPLGRRQLLAGGALAGLGAWAAEAGAQQAKPLPAYVAWKDPDSMIVHSSSTLETRRSAFGTSVILRPSNCMSATTCRRLMPPFSRTATAGKLPLKV